MLAFSQTSVTYCVSNISSKDLCSQDNRRFACAQKRRVCRPVSQKIRSQSNAQQRTVVSKAQETTRRDILSAFAAASVSWTFSAEATAKKAPTAPEGPALDQFYVDVRNLAVLLKEGVELSVEGGDASDLELYEKQKTLSKPVKDFFLSYGLRDGRMVLNKKLYAGVPEYITMYTVLNELNEFKKEAAMVNVAFAEPGKKAASAFAADGSKIQPRVPIELKDKLVAELDTIIG
ncbi:hypothetical protein CYMTET_4470 [Cymbomonas tetramitiformis]|uniref:Uncharacterized protein n=1 Tax=Cymbomonas tetramitiformis TaxID=36881 RepID=A0AAE0H1A0_9CHLO|nr:hypothetical protein CYMTET_4470 [Cymbomonas tetramitiformis]